jgi:hypothetical protein
LPQTEKTKTEKEAMPTYKQNQGADLLDKGVYPFYVRNAEETTSTTGNPLIKLTLQVNGTFTVFDNLTFVENAFWKIDQFRIATGEKLGRPGSEIVLEADDCIQRKGEVAIDIDEFPKNSGHKRNIVVEYINPSTNGPLPASAAGPGTGPKAQSKAEPNDIPF